MAEACPKTSARTVILRNNGFKRLHGLRGLISVHVMLHHVVLLSYFPDPSYSLAGELAPQLFIALSGFCLTLGYGKNLEENQFSFRTYLKRRILRLYPLYWLSVISHYATADMTNQSTFFSSISDSRFLMIFSLNILGVVGWFIPITGPPSPTVLWTINVLVLYYLLFPKLCSWLLRASPKIVSCLKPTLIASYIVIIVPGLCGYLMYGMSPLFYWPPFILGIMAAIEIQRSQDEITKMKDDLNICDFYFFLYLLCIAWKFFPKGSDLFIANMIQFAMLYFQVELIKGLYKFESSSIIGRITSSKFVQLLGDMHYTVYLFHFQLQDQFNKLTYLNYLDDITFCIVSSLAQLPCLYLIHIFIAKPVTRYCSRWL